MASPRNVRVVTGPRPTGEIERAQEFADALMVRALRSRNPEQRWRVATAMSPWEGVAQLGEAWLAGKMQRRASELAQAEDDRQRAANAAMIRQIAGEEAPRFKGEIETRAPMPNYGQPTGRAGQAIRMPLDLETGEPMITSSRGQMLESAVNGMEPRQAGSALGGAMLSQALATPKYERVDLGNEIGVVDERGNIVQRIPKGVTPDARLREQGSNYRHEIPSGSARLGADVSVRGQDVSAATTRRGQDLTYDAALRGQAATGNKFALEQAQVAEKEQRAREEGLLKADRVMGAVESALGLTSPRTAGWMGAATRNLAPFGGAGTDAYTLASTVETVKANLGFDELQKMRQSSPTGGALGQVAVQELVALQATVANLDPNQPAEVLKANLEKIYQHYGNWKATLQGQMPGQPAGTPGADAGLWPNVEQRAGGYYDQP